MRKKYTVSYELDPERPAPLTPARKVELETLAGQPGEQIDTSDIPPLSETFWQNAVRNPFYRPVKQQVTVRWTPMYSPAVVALDRTGISVQAQRHPAPGHAARRNEAMIADGQAVS
jgi:hypothetical protein